MEEVLEVSCHVVPVSTSVRFILYSRMIPFCSLGGGRSHDKNIVRELEANPTGFCGGLVGTVGNNNLVLHYYSNDLARCNADNTVPIF